jgi:hypothetical protein
MRLSKGTASHALVIALAALFAGCSSTSPGSQSLPLGSAPLGSAQSAARRPCIDPGFVPKGRMTPSKLLRLQADCKLAGSVPAAVLRRQLAEVQSHRRPTFGELTHRHSSPSIGLWTTNTDFGYLFGQTANGSTTVAAIDTEFDACFVPVTVKVDANQNVWVACELNADNENEDTGGAIQEYNSKGHFANRYAYSVCVTDYTSCFGYGFDGSANSKDVFATVTYYFTESSSVSETGSGFEYWPLGKPSATPTLISLPYGDPVYDVYYMDLDNKGNIWFDYAGCIGSNCGYGLAEEKTPTTAPTFVPILAVGSIGFPGGVYVSDKGKVLNVLDQEARTISQYHLPLSPSGTPFKVLGPTVANSADYGDPVSGGFNQKETAFTAGDAYGWLDTGEVSPNAWHAAFNLNFAFGVEGAAYTPSDR